MNRSRSDNPEVQEPKILPNTIDGVSRNYIFGYAKSIRNTNQAMLDLFNDVNVLNTEEEAFKVPIIFGSQEKAIMYVFGDQAQNADNRMDDGYFNRIKLPVLGLQQTAINHDQSRFIHHEARRPIAYGAEKRPYDVMYRISKGVPVNLDYQLNLWSKYHEQLMQMVEQIFQKFSPMAYINVEGILWETPVKITGTGSNVDSDVEDRRYRILKYSFGLQVEGHIAQPIRRDKTVLSIKQKYALMGDLIKSAEIDTFTEEPGENEKPNKL